MNNTIQYKGYVGSIEFSEEDKIFYGKVLGIRSLISYEGENATELIDDFHQAVDDYLELCKKSGQTPETAFKGSFNVRISPELHKQVFVYAMAHQISMNRRNTCQISSSSRRSLIYMKNMAVTADTTLLPPPPLRLHTR